jgi:hypothetical protein
MITENDLLNLRYKVITRLEDTDNTVEFIHEDLDKMSYLVKLRKGEIQTIFPNSIYKAGWRTKNIEELIEWHYLYLQISELI